VCRQTERDHERALALKMPCCGLPKGGGS